MIPLAYIVLPHLYLQEILEKVKISDTNIPNFLCLKSGSSIKGKIIYCFKIGCCKKFSFDDYTKPRYGDGFRVELNIISGTHFPS